MLVLIGPRPCGFRGRLLTFVVRFGHNLGKKRDERLGDATTEALVKLLDTVADSLFPNYQALLSKNLGVLASSHKLHLRPPRRAVQSRTALPSRGSGPFLLQ